MVAATSWDRIESEKLSATFTRKMISGIEATLARIVLARGAIVPRHSHRSEQYSVILSGSLKLIFDDGEAILHGGELIVIPSNVPHAAKALEDTVAMDYFAPRREDWIRKEDSYLRAGAERT
jgi:quercetin dioxygenase-like cupin family protein